MPRLPSRHLLFVAAVMAIAAPTATRATEGPWCAVLNFGSAGPGEVCSMPTFEACRELAMHYGTASFCRQNPAWPGYYSSGAQGHNKKHKRRTSHH